MLPYDDFAAAGVAKGVTDGTATWNDIVVGLLVVVLAGLRLTRPVHNEWASWTNCGLGAWLVLTHFVLGLYPVAATWNDVVCDVLIAVLAAMSAGAARKARAAVSLVRRGRGIGPRPMDGFHPSAAARTSAGSSLVGSDRTREGSGSSGATRSASGGSPGPRGRPTTPCGTSLGASSDGKECPSCDDPRGPDAPHRQEVRDR